MSIKEGIYTLLGFLMAIGFFLTLYQGDSRWMYFGPMTFICFHEAELHELKKKWEAL